MNLDQFREALSSDATRRNAAQEKTIKALRKEIEWKDSEIAELSDVLRTMFNRCYVNNAMGIGLCIFCGNADLCDKLRNVGKVGAK